MALFFRLPPGDVAGFKLLLSLAIMYGMMSVSVYYVMHLKFITPLGMDAPLDRFSEARAIEHVRVLAQDIDGRQVGRPGLNEAAQYIRNQLEAMKGRAGSHIRIEIEENFVDGSFNMMFLGHSLSLGYKNHTNIVMRVTLAFEEILEVTSHDNYVVFMKEWEKEIALTRVTKLSLLKEDAS